MENKPLVKTTDEETANFFREMGLKELPQEGNRWVFVNEWDKINFSEEKNLKYNFSNILCV